MGYRLEMSEIKYSACGGKLYGYVDDEKQLKSYKWLLDRGYINGDEYWSYCFNPRIILNSIDFKEFIKLYLEDFKQERKCDFPYIEDLKKLESSENDVLLEWW